MVSPEQSVVSLDQTFENGGLYSVRAAVAAHASSLGASTHQVGHLVLIASELVTNAIAYGGGRGRIRVWHERAQVHCEVSDTGPGIPDTTDLGFVQPAAASQGGRGLWVARTLSDNLAIVTGESGTTITVSMTIGKD
jgi:anti-sigma regulatory factor (Ser/Thr protein kinase)